MTRKKKSGRDAKPRQMLYGHYLVAFLDVMGQRDALRRMTVPTTDGQQAYDEILPLLKATAGKVAGVRDMIQSTLRSLSAPNELRSGAPPEIRKLMDAVRQPSVRAMRFSDSIVLFMPMAGVNPANVGSNVLSLLSSVAFTLISCFAGKTPIRGGIEIGAGIDIGRDEIYGAALERAYSLESSFADYPRVLVGSELLQFLTMMSESHPETPLERLAVSFARMSLNLIAYDGDGLAVLDYLSQQVFEHSKEVLPDPTEMFDMGYSFARGEHERFLTEGSLGLASRYGRLVSFYEGHRELWSEASA